MVEGENGGSNTKAEEAMVRTTSSSLADVVYKPWPCSFRLGWCCWKALSGGNIRLVTSLDEEMHKTFSVNVESSSTSSSSSFVAESMFIVIELPLLLLWRRRLCETTTNDNDDDGADDGAIVNNFLLPHNYLLFVWCLFCCRNEQKPRRLILDWDCWARREEQCEGRERRNDIIRQHQCAILVQWCFKRKFEIWRR